MMEILLFGDQTVDQLQFLRKLVLRKNHAVLVSFLERASHVLQTEVLALPKARRDSVPPFTNIANLVEHYTEGKKRVCELECVFLTISQLGHFIGAVESQYINWPNGTEVRTIGLCTGLLAASAINCARSLSELIPLALEAIRIAFRVGRHTCDVRDGLQVTNEDPASWSTIIADISERNAQEAIDEFHHSNHVPGPLKAFVSAVSSTAVTLSGPPQTTRQLFEASKAFRKCHRVTLPIFAPFHAPHLFNSTDVDAILDLQSEQLLKQFHYAGTLHSSTTGSSLEAGSAYDLMRIVLEEILSAPVRWDRVLENFANHSVNQERAPGGITVLGVANTPGSLAAALNSTAKLNIAIKDHTSWKQEPHLTNGRTQNDKIAIVGMSGRFPDAADHEALWDLLMGGLDVHKEVPSDRFDAHAHLDSSGKGRNKSHTPYGCFISEPGLFDPRFFNMSPREAAQTDPMGRLALVTAYEALEMSGYVPNRTKSTRSDRIGTFYGQTSDDWREINAAEDIDTYFITGGVRAFAPGRINYYFKFSGPSFSIDTACSSSTAAIQLACTSLWAGDVDTACAGGMNVLTNPDIFAGLSKGQFLSKTGSCKTYDNDADGYCRGDGVATVILKRYQDAVADNDHILGCILAAGTNHSAEAVSITHPHAGAQEFLYKKILAEAGVDAHDISYVEMHGTGTQAGDGIEMSSVTNTFAPSHRQRKSNQPLYLGALKANIGHGEASSGISSLIKVILMMQNNYIPPNVGIKGSMNKTFPTDLGKRNVHIPQSAVPYPRPHGQSRKIFLNNFSAAGGNTAMLLEDPPTYQSSPVEDIRSHFIVTVTARAISSLKRNIHNLVDYLDKNPQTKLSSLSYTTTARRMQHNYRVAIVAKDMSQVRGSLLSQVRDSYNPISSSPTSVAFVFTGQGSQYDGIAKQLYHELPSFRKDIHRLETLTLAHGFSTFLPLVDGSESISDLSPVVVQLGMVCVQIALARMWIAWGLKPQAVIGHSLGEYAALHIAGVLSASDTIFLVGRRAELLMSKCESHSHGMLAVKASKEEIVDVLVARMLQVACRNTPLETVLSGTLPAIETASSKLTERGIKNILLKVPYAFHSDQIDPIQIEFEKLASSATFHRPTLPVLSPLTGNTVSDAGTFGPSYLARHARETVDFLAALSNGKAAGTFDDRTAWMEIGPHPICSNMIGACINSGASLAGTLRRGEDSWKTLTTSICTLYSAGVYINFDEFHREYSHTHDLLTLPTYSFDNKTYWLDYHNNWTLSKGQDPMVTKPEPQEFQKREIYTSSCQRIIKREIKTDSGIVIFQTNLADPSLAPAVRGHVVNQNPLCPSSLYADQALTAADYLYRALRPDASEIGKNVGDMTVSNELIAQLPPPPEGQHIQIEASADMSLKRAIVKYRSVTPDGKLLREHAQCIVTFENVDQWTQNWDMISYMVRSQIDKLERRLSSGQAHKVLRGMAYKLFKNFVDYSLPYRGMSEVIIDSEETEATALIKFQPDDANGTYRFAPYWIDSLAHLSGFICNGTDLVDSDRYRYISHGWSSLRLRENFSETKTYQSYVKMHERPGNIRMGDVYIFEGTTIVGVVGGLKFKQLERRLLDVILPPPNIKSIKKTSKNANLGAATIALPNSIPPISEVSAKASDIKEAATVGMSSRVMSIVAEECDIDMAELVDDAEFENLGVDSLLSLTISARLREDLDLEVPSNLFTDQPTVGRLRKYFSASEDAPVQDDSSSSSGYDSTFASPGSESDETSISPPMSTSDVDENRDRAKQLNDAHEDGSGRVPRATSVVLQGNMKTASKKLFLFPDGSGSATSYVAIDRVDDDVCVIGLNCPFMKNPKQFTIGIDGVAALYLEEVKRRQPDGPYFIGGWSAGGVVAYEVSIQLHARGDTVEKLILLDSPCPIDLEPLPTRLHHFFDSIGLLGTGPGSRPDWLLPHFEYAIKALDEYKPASMLPGSTPDTLAVWATKGVCSNPDDPRPSPAEGEDPKPMKWLLNDRSDFGHNGWGALLGDAMKFDTIEANHFSMMTTEHGSELANLIKKGLGLAN